MHTLKNIIIALWVITATTFNLYAQNNTKPPLWEIGLTGITTYSPSYLGSNDYDIIALPLPNIIYRGEFLRLQNNKLRAVLLETDDTEFNIAIRNQLSADGDSDDRLGMPDLDRLMDIGPTFRYKIYKTNQYNIGFELPLGVVYSIFGDEFLEQRGTVLNPQIAYTSFNRLYGSNLSYGFGLGPMFGDKSINEYFYNIDSKYANANRSTYQAKAGYMGSQLSGFFNVSLNKYVSFFTASKLVYLGGAANENSPLVKSKFNASLVAGLTWSLYRSETAGYSNY